MTKKRVTEKTVVTKTRTVKAAPEPQQYVPPVALWESIPDACPDCGVSMLRGFGLMRVCEYCGKAWTEPLKAQP